MTTVKAFRYFNDLLKQIKSGLRGEVNVFLDGGRESGKTIATVLFYAILFVTTPHVGVWVFRHTPQGARESYKQFVQVAKEFLNFPSANFSRQDKTFTFKGHQISFNGYLTNRKVKVGKLGIARDISAKIKIIVFDEITEFDKQDDIDYCEQAVGSAKLLIKVKICNPFSPHHWFVKKLVQKLPYSPQILKAKGEQFVSFYQSPQHLVVYHHTNHRVNTLLDAQAHQLYEKLSKTNPFLGLTADLGMPGIERGAVYLPLLKNLRPPLPFHEPIWAYRGGVDWGESSHVGASSCVAIFGRIGQRYKGLSADAEYWHNNSKSVVRKDTQQLVDEVAQFFVNKVTDHVKKQGGIEVFVDSAAIGVVRLLETASAKLPNGGFVYYAPCYKLDVCERIKIVKFLMAEKRVCVNRTLCPNLGREGQMATYDESKLGTQEVRLKQNDDCLDAFEYLVNADLVHFTNTFYHKIKAAL